ncbi:MAG: hypothetical protein M3P06_03020 [Acidobacteriota bacterium]|nr:hypothetical protein [Acidobacteriota bacterium]
MKCLQPLETAPRAPAAAEVLRAESGTAAEEMSMYRRYQGATEQLENAATEREKEIAWQTWEDVVFQYYEDGYQIVTLIGFSMAGKTFFANRLRYELSLDGWNVDPRAEDKRIERTAAKIDWTQLTRGGKHPRRRVLADCDGEAYRESIDDLIKGDSVDENLRRYVLMTALASAYILMVPASATLEPTGDADDLVGQFDVIVNAILTLQRRLRETGDARKVVREGLTGTFVRKALVHEFQCDRPIHVLFAQADKLSQVEQYESDPAVYAMTHARTLYKRIDNRFTNYRFDFVSAFAGYDDNSEKPIDYSLPHYGALAAFDWIDGMIEKPPLWKLTTAAAMRTRRLLDGGFRKARRMASQ